MRGYIRRSEKETLTRRNFPDEGNLRVIDVEFMANRLGLPGLAAREAYVELIGEDQDTTLKAAT